MTTTEPAAEPATEAEPELVSDALEGADAEEHATEAQPIAEPPPAVEQPVAPTAIVTRPQRSGETQMIPGTELAIVPAVAELGQLAQMAVTLAAADAVPTAMRGKPNDVFLVLLTARDVGVALTTALREFHVIEGKVTMSPKVKLAMIRQQGLGLIYPHQAPRQHVQPDGTVVTLLCRCGRDDPANGATSATWHAERHDEPGILHSSTYTLEMAGRVRTKEKGSDISLAEKSTWKAYPERMLSWRASGYLIDDVYGEVGTGLYSPDEMGAVTDENGEPVIDVVAHADPLPGTKAPRGHNKPPPPPPPAATDDVLAGLRKRIDGLPAEGRKALVAMWTEGKGTDAGPRLPPLGHLLEKDVKKADALVKSIEQRARKGEWGEWSPPTDEPGDAAAAPGDGPKSPPDEPPAAEPTDGAQSTEGAAERSEPDGDAEQPTTAESGAGEPAEPDPLNDVVQTIIDDVAAMTDHAVRAELDVRSKSRNGNTRTVRTRLAMYRAKDAGVQVTEAEIKHAAPEGDS